MKTAIERLLEKHTITVENLHAEIEFIQYATNRALQERKIDVQIRLSTGSVLTGLKMLEKMMNYRDEKFRYDQSQARINLLEIYEKAKHYNEMFPELDNIIESYRKKKAIMRKTYRQTRLSKKWK